MSPIVVEVVAEVVVGVDSVEVLDGVVMVGGIPTAKIDLNIL